MSLRGDKSFFQQIQRSFQLLLQFCAFRQIELVSAPGLYKISRQGSEGRALSGFFLVFVLHSLHRATRCAGRCGLGSILLRAAASFD